MPKLEMKQPIITHMYTADPSAHIFKRRIYIYPSHDLDHDNLSNDNGDQYDMEDYHVFSMKNFNSRVKDHGEVLHMKNIPWVKEKMWAPDAAFKNKTYYLYFPAKDKNGVFRIGVATSKKPYGPFIPQPEPIKNSFSIDPAVFIDDDGSAYMYFGGLWGGQLQNWQDGTFNPNAKEPEVSLPAIGPRFAKLSDNMLEFESHPKEISILDENGKPLLSGDNSRRYFEGPWVHKYMGLYYLSYSTGDTHYLVYATSKSPEGPFQFRGRILNPVIGWTTHHSIIEYKKRWYLFYHDSSLSGGKDNKRSIKFMELFYNDDGTIKMMDP
jgi:beta-xylosidase